MRDPGVPYGRGPAPTGNPKDKGEWLRTAGHPPMRIMGRFFIWEILNMPEVGGRWAGRGEQETGAGEGGRGKESSVTRTRTPWGDSPVRMRSPMCT